MFAAPWVCRSCSRLAARPLRSSQLLRRASTGSHQSPHPRTRAQLTEPPQSSTHLQRRPPPSGPPPTRPEASRRARLPPEKPSNRLRQQNRQAGRGARLRRGRAQGLPRREGLPLRARRPPLLPRRRAPRPGARRRAPHHGAAPVRGPAPVRRADAQASLRGDAVPDRVSPGPGGIGVEVLYR